MASGVHKTHHVHEGYEDPSAIRARDAAVLGRLKTS